MPNGFNTISYEQGQTWKIDLSIQDDPDYDWLCPYVKVAGFYDPADDLVFASAFAMGKSTGEIYRDLPVWFKTAGATLIQEAF